MNKSFDSCLASWVRPLAATLFLVSKVHNKSTFDWQGRGWQIVIKEKKLLSAICLEIIWHTFSSRIAKKSIWRGNSPLQLLLSEFPMSSCDDTIWQPLILCTTFVTFREKLHKWISPVVEAFYSLTNELWLEINWLWQLTSGLALLRTHH